MRIRHGRFTAAVTLGITVLLGSASVPAVAEVHRTPAACAATLDCTAGDIDRMTMAERLDLVRALSDGPAAEVIPGYTPRWRNIEGIVEFFRANDMGAPGTWVSHVDAGIIEGIERGIAIASGRDEDTFGNPGSTLWANYLTRLRDGGLASRSAHDQAWSEAEQASTEHGKALAEQVHGVPPTAVEQRFYEFSDFYRLVLRNRSPLLDPLSPGPGPGSRRQLTFLDWFTDVGNATPSLRGAELAHGIAEFDLPDGAAKTVALLAAYTEYLLTDYLDQTGAPAPQSS
ncbi:hypothetical protein CFN78_06175 [Amycolatopsis antarctica]|uniref:Uncharacterized protein n=1 Tax=Amycolatopsis antarctica TaxID=1854586 RepID=A0A263D640_9PSEU|nr:hypothetical protein [Amycolatopsis antarctica]OZM73883.1 hypothetical protein CFN78_06175 [Amycolatopsis antarctica]